MHENHIEVSIEIDVTEVKPYYLKFDYVGDSMFKDRLLNVAKAGEYVLTAKESIFKKSCTYKWRSYYGPSRKQWWASMKDLLNREKIRYLQFENKNEVESACLEIQKLLNEFIEKENKIYKKLILEQQQKS